MGHARYTVAATLLLRILTGMLTRQRGWYTVQETADELGITPTYVGRLIHNGVIAADPIGGRGYQVWPTGVEEYKRTRQGTQGWDKREAEGYAPSKDALYAHAYRARKRRESSAVVDVGLPPAERQGEGE